jgi:hypothetical protein
MKPDTTMSLNSDDNVNDDTVLQALLMEMASAPTSVSANTAMQQRLQNRVRDSAELAGRMVTVRHGDTPWQIVEPGVSVRALHDNGITRTRMLALQPGATWQQARACEALVMQGALRVANVAPALPMESFVLSAGATTFSGGPLGALLYVRELYGDSHQLPAAELAWWPAPGTAPVVVAADAQGWLPFGPGVEIKPLHGSDAAISIFARFAPGASVAAHGHGLDEDCIMLRGDLYLSDTLLREGEYQLAPLGTGHKGLASDGGAVLFFHGAIDSNLRGG